MPRHKEKRKKERIEIIYRLVLLMVYGSFKMNTKE